MAPVGACECACYVCEDSRIESGEAPPRDAAELATIGVMDRVASEPRSKPQHLLINAMKGLMDSPSPAEVAQMESAIEVCDSLEKGALSEMTEHVNRLQHL